MIHITAVGHTWYSPHEHRHFAFTVNHDDSLNHAICLNVPIILIVSHPPCHFNVMARWTRMAMTLTLQAALHVFRNMTGLGYITFRRNPHSIHRHPCCLRCTFASVTSWADGCTAGGSGRNSAFIARERDMFRGVLHGSTSKESFA